MADRGLEGVEAKRPLEGLESGTSKRVKSSKAEEGRVGGSWIGNCKQGERNGDGGVLWDFDLCISLPFAEVGRCPDGELTDILPPEAVQGWCLVI